MPQLTCRQVNSFLMDYLDGSLAPTVARDFAHHLAICPDCVRYLQSYQETIRLGKAAFHDPDALATDLPDPLLAAILKRCQPQRRPSVPSN